MGEWVRRIQDEDDNEHVDEDEDDDKYVDEDEDDDDDDDAHGWSGAAEHARRR